ncbi:MAG: D-aminoacylase, partial [Variovorax sp.]
MFDLIIEGGTVIDGTGAPRMRADLGILAGRIARIGDLADVAAHARFDARERIVAPGFIDVHTHDD